ncbi:MULTISPECIES: glutaredoxin family protein [Micrococcaceae]|uniref:glutaredoxin family protein n=1 Tax=Micrococcaceae TaxID=1268 RepID=UPI000B3500E6|nr:MULTISPECIES: glutaredoxin family protein [Micrococcaceae]PCC26023.1 glutaredoxin family protein [Glutamicibacter sp. BW78]
MDSSFQTPRVRLLSRTGCHLCAAARTTVQTVAERHGVAWDEVLIDDDPALMHEFGEEVPVLLVDGVQRDFWVIDADRLEKLIGA